jgi:uncharacterized protein (DUF2147 family)
MSGEMMPGRICKAAAVAFSLAAPLCFSGGNSALACEAEAWPCETVIAKTPPVNANAVPANTYAAPANADAAPANADAPPANANTAPANTYAAPTNTNTAPANTYAPPANTNAAPPYTNAAPANANAAPANGNAATKPAKAAPAPGRGGAPDITGVWITDDGLGAVEIAPCGEKRCGRLVWMKNPRDARGQLQNDVNNPNTKLQRRPLCGAEIISGLARQRDQSWDAGRIYDPKDGDSHDLAAKLKNPNELEITGYEGTKWLSETFVWRRSAAGLVRCDTQSPAAAPASTPAAAAPASARAAKPRAEDDD